MRLIFGFRHQLVNIDEIEPKLFKYFLIRLLHFEWHYGGITRQHLDFFSRADATQRCLFTFLELRVVIVRLWLETASSLGNTRNFLLFTSLFHEAQLWFLRDLNFQFGNFFGFKDTFLDFRNLGRNWLLKVVLDGLDLVQFELVGLAEDLRLFI